MNIINNIIGYYSPIFSSLQQKDISGFLTYLWQAEPCKGKWSIIAKAYSIVRDLKGKEDAPLDSFLRINAPYVGIVKPEEYMSVLGWNIEIDHFGQLILRRTADLSMRNFDSNILTTNVSVEDVVRNSYELGYIEGGDGTNLVATKNEAALTMAATAQAVGTADVNSTASSDVFNPNAVVPSDGDPKCSQTSIQSLDSPKHPVVAPPKFPIGPSDFKLAGEHPFDAEFEPGLESFEFDPQIGNRFNALDVGDGYEIKVSDLDLDFDFSEWTVDA